MARNQALVEVTAGSWVQLTNADVTSITFQVQDGDIFLRFTTDTTTPTEDGGIAYWNATGELSKNLSDMTALSGAARVWAKSQNPRDNAFVYVDHA